MRSRRSFVAPAATCLGGVLAAFMFSTGSAVAATPRTGSYSATTSQCGSPALPHSCYAFAFRIAKGRCSAPGSRRVRTGFCVTFIQRLQRTTMVYADVTCPDSKEFAAQFTGPSGSYLLSRTGSLRFSQDSSVTEEGKQFVVGVEKLSLNVNGSRATGSLSTLVQEQLGLEPPQCSSGTVSFTAKRT
jgi:hypothetical protein